MTTADSAGIATQFVGTIDSSTGYLLECVSPEYVLVYSRPERTQVRHEALDGSRVCYPLFESTDHTEFRENLITHFQNN